MNERRAGPRDATDVVDLDDKLARVHEHWSPRIVAAVNDTHVKVAKLLGTFDWHRHPDEDEAFWVLRGTLLIRFRDRDDVTLRPGQMCVVPRGVEHQPVAEEEVHLVLIEPAGTLNTGDVRSARTVDEPEWL